MSIYDNFKCDNVSVEILEKNGRDKGEKSILFQNKFQIDEYIERTKVDVKNKYIEYELGKSNVHFIDFKKNKHIYKFSKNIISRKNEINIMQKKIDIFLKFNKSLYKNIYLNYNKLHIIYNPIQYSVLKECLPNIRESDDIEIALDILTQGNIINLSLPSIGILYKHISKNTDGQNYTNFINKIHDTNDLNTLIQYIPLKKINIGETISKFLGNISYKNNGNDGNNENNGNNINDTKDLIKKIIDNLDITSDEIFYIPNEKNKSKKVKIEYLIPYKYDSLKLQFEELDKSKIEPYKSKTINEIHAHNKDLLDIALKNQNSKFNKHILACFLFYVINVTYDICKKYISKIDNIIKQIITSKDKRFKKLNIADVFKYTTDLSQSLLNFKKILLNNFYQLFVPSKLTGLYGMIYNTNGCFIPDKDTIFTIDDTNFYEKYPFEKCSEDKIKNFLLNIVNKNDVHEPEKVLELGGFIYDTSIMKKTCEILCEKYSNIEKCNNFILFILNYVIDNFKKKKIPFDLFKDEMTEAFLLKNYKKYLEESTNNYLKVLEIREKIKLLKHVNSNLVNLEQIYLLCFNINLTVSLCYVPITLSDILLDGEKKKKLLIQYAEIKKINETKILKQINK